MRVWLSAWLPFPSARGPPGARSGYLKYCPRSAEDKPLVGVAALLVLDAGRRVGEIRIGLAGAAPTPMRARQAEAMVTGQALTDRAIRGAADAAASEAEPLSDLMGSADYRREMIRVWVRRLLTALRDGRSLTPRSAVDQLMSQSP
jgi:CO/xanthine dehydrogenase FAD-binding subunit